MSLAALEWAIALAAAVVRTAAAEGMAVGLVAPGVVRPPRIGHRHVDLLICDLAVADGTGEVDAWAVAARTGGCVVVSGGGAPPPSIARRARTLQAMALESLVVRELAGGKLTLLGSARESVIPAAGGRSLAGAAA